MADHPYAPFIALMDRAAAEPDVDLRVHKHCLHGPGGGDASQCCTCGVVVHGQPYRDSWGVLGGG